MPISGSKALHQGFNSIFYSLRQMIPKGSFCGRYYRIGKAQCLFHLMIDLGVFVDP